MRHIFTKLQRLNIVKNSRLFTLLVALIFSSNLPAQEPVETA